MAGTEEPKEGSTRLGFKGRLGNENKLLCGASSVALAPSRFGCCCSMDADHDTRAFARHCTRGPLRSRVACYNVAKLESHCPYLWHAPCLEALLVLFADAFVSRGVSGRKKERPRSFWCERQRQQPARTRVCRSFAPREATRVRLLTRLLTWRTPRIAWNAGILAQFSPEKKLRAQLRFS